MTTDLDLAERSVIGSVLLSNGKILDDLDFNPADYRHPVYETVHRTAQAMKAAGKPVDIVTVMGELTAAGERYEPAMLHQAVTDTPVWENADYYAGIVADAATGRRLVAAGAKAKQLVEAGGDMPEIVEAVRRDVDNAQSSARAQPVEFLADTLPGTIDMLDSEVTATPTPWPTMNDLITGLLPGAVYVVGARPGVGKSVVAVQLAQALLASGSVAFVSLEMNRDDVNLRLMSSELEINMGKLVNRNLDEHDWTKVSAWLRTASERPLAVLDKPGATITDIKRFVRSVNRRKPLAGIVVDYLQLMNPPTGDKRPRHEFVSAMSRELKILALDMNVPVVVLSQLNRGSTAREDTRPQISDLRESGAIEQDADVVLLLHREFPGDKQYEIGLAVAKNRRGRTGSFTAEFRGHYSRIDEAGA